MGGRVDVRQYGRNFSSTNAGLSQTLREKVLPYKEKFRLKKDNIEPIFKQDNASIHALRLTKGFLNANNVTTMECSAKRLDFNIMEGLLVGRVYANGRRFDSRAELKAFIKPGHVSSPIKSRNFVKSMPKRLHLAMALKGATALY
ncbi:uncharacterized protein PITG_09947 [Phytophthora infestans T30-4]|uniref:Uncharacterized protein n=2 Tax=Phytophthora infestans TaxID=4787 RepID=D0NDX3_PHYIT|nr:uncharacterized protein PITG_09947 [Phytophthora infestans T30-4]EEY56418.1 hypothetical protein PITG_09947 [Phytophthora infestans T30-4]|eukprot:XP_002902492.1 hypothetical protein PITG_09947 [Phytophthora infestans T30-4]